MAITKEQVMKALDSLEGQLGDESVSKASEQDLDQPEGADLGNPAKEKLSSEAPGPDSSPKGAKKKDKDAKKSLESDADIEKGGGKENDEDEDEDEDDNKADEDEDEEDEGETEKSFSASLPEEVQAKIDVSEFLKSLVDRTGDAIDGLRDYVAKSDAAQESRYGAVIDTVAEIQKSQGKIGIVLKALCERVGIIENAPAHPPKAETVAKSGAVERQFSSGVQVAEAGNEQEKMFKSLSDDPRVAKGQITDALVDLVKGGEAQDVDVINFEGGGYIRPDLINKLKQKLG